MHQLKLFSAYKSGILDLQNRVVMAPLTRSRAIGNIPNDLMAEYYRQRSGAGLIITEGTSPSPNGLGYPRIPGIFSKEQVEGWKKITTAIHAGGAKVFIQLMHTGRISHVLNLPEGGRVLAPSAVKAAGKIRNDSKVWLELPVPEEMFGEDIQSAIKEYTLASENALEAGFDGVEIHGANGYLPEEFLSPLTNQRTDHYGGSVANRCRFVVEVVNAVSNAIGKEKTGIRLSPYGVASDMSHYPEIDETYQFLAREFNDAGICYIHLVDHSSTGAPVVPEEIKRMFRDRFRNTLILSGGYDKMRAEADLVKNSGDLIAFGKPFINNPDLVERMKNNWPLSTELHKDLFYSAGEKGYTDYSFYNS